MASDDILDELADLVAARLEQRRQHHESITKPSKWTDRLAAVLEEYYQAQLSLPDGNVVGDRTES